MDGREATLYIGTMGWTYRDWVGVFYPPGTDERDFLTHYSRVFNALEIDSTFYYVPRPEVVTAWYQKTPHDFVFTAKMPRMISHERGLVETDDILTPFLSSIALLGNKLGCLLLQLAPSFRCAPVSEERLNAFLNQLPTDDFRFAVEFRHPSWIKTSTLETLKSHRVAWTIQDHPSLMPIIPELTADFTYIRWMGEHNDPRITSVRETLLDRTQDIIRWAERLRQDILPGVNTLFGFFNNHYAGYSPASCNQVKRLLGQDTVVPRFDQQMDLF
jgi:uncharacterized protein YecE (DUF72 family)